VLADQDIQIGKLPQRKVSVGESGQGWPFVGDSGDTLRLEQV
jgi:hypothetical protein